MLRCIGVLYATLTSIAGFVLRDDNTGAISQQSNAQVHTLVMAHKIKNLRITHGKISCIDCAIDKLPKYTVNGFCLDHKPVYQIIGISYEHNCYCVLHDLTHGDLISRDAIVDLLNSGVCFCNAYLTRTGTFVIANTSSLYNIDAPVCDKPVRHKAMKFLYLDGISAEEFLSNTKYQEGIVANFALSLGIPFSQFTIYKAESKCTEYGKVDAYVLNTFHSGRTKQEGLRPDAPWRITFDLDPEDISVNFKLGPHRGVLGYHDYIDFYYNKYYYSLDFSQKHVSSTLLMDFFERASMDDSVIPEKLSTFMMKFSEKASRIAPVSFSNIPTPEYISQLYEKLNNATRDGFDINTYVTAARAAWHHWITITGLGLHLRLEMPLVRLDAQHDPLVFTHAEFVQCDELWRPLHDQITGLIQGDVTDTIVLLNFI